MDKYILKLYITGQTHRSNKAMSNLKEICEKELDNRFEIKIIDVLQEPDLAESEKIFVTPTLIKEIPLPIRRIIGDLSDKDKVLMGLDIIKTWEDGNNDKTQRGS